MNIIHQIWISKNNESPPEYIINKIDKLKSIYYEYKHTLYSNDDIRKILNNNFERNIIDCYDSLIPYAFKSDLARYCLLYLYGGYYWDISVCPDEKFEFYQDVVLLNGDKSVYGSNGKDIVDNGFMFFKEPNNPILLDAINQVVRNVSLKKYTDHPLGITGPIMLGNIISTKKYNYDILFADVIYNEPSKKVYINNIFFYDFKPNFASSDLSKLGAIGTNSYEDLWFQNDVYVFNEKNVYKKFLLFINIDDHSIDLINSIVSGDYNFDIAINYCGNDNNKLNKFESSNFDYLFNNKGCLWENIIKNKKLFNNYKYVSIIDEDIKLDLKKIDESFHISESTKYWAFKWFNISENNFFENVEFNSSHLKTSFIGCNFIFINKILLIKIIEKYIELGFVGDYLTDILISNVGIHERKLPYYILREFTYKSSRKPEINSINKEIVINYKKFFRIYKTFEIEGIKNPLLTNL